ncbi:MAG: hypothetical protein MJ247_04155 [Alphaproteobacteria bacterium]|nr:hypothetical protein [Alphaproteobacteria bacterium]
MDNLICSILIILFAFLSLFEKDILKVLMYHFETVLVIGIWFALSHYQQASYLIVFIKIFEILILGIFVLFIISHNTLKFGEIKKRYYFILPVIISLFGVLGYNFGKEKVLQRFIDTTNATVVTDFCINVSLLGTIIMASIIGTGIVFINYRVDEVRK